MQTRICSIIESVCNVFIGYLVSVISQLVIFPLFNIYVSLVVNLKIGVFFTVVSIIRSYSIRRIFNRIRVNK